MDDIEGDQFSASFVIREQSINNADETFGVSRDLSSSFLEITSVTRIYNRISPFINDKSNIQDYALQDSVYTDDYLKLLEETEKTLRLYREKIKDKLQ